MTARSGRRSAFTLIELLVVIAIISTLMALLLPAIQKAREAANLMICGSQLRQLAIAAHVYHNDHKKLPAGMYNTISQSSGFLANEGPYVGVITVLLPYFEQDALYSALRYPDNTPAPGRPLLVNAVANTGAPWWDTAKTGGYTNVNAADLARAKISMLKCPSDTPDENLNEVYLATIGDPGAPWWMIRPTIANETAFGRTSYFGVAGMNYENWWVSGYEGILRNRSTVTLGQITSKDGTSNTLFFGESVGEANYDQTGTYGRFAWMGAGALTTSHGLGARGKSKLEHGPMAERFSSNHTAGVQFVMADGSVRSVRPDNTNYYIFDASAWYWGSGNPWDSPDRTDYVNGTPEWRVLQQLGAWKDGRRFDISIVSD